MKQVMIYAYTAHNLGDDLFIHILCSRYPNTQFHLYAPEQYQTTFKHLDNLTVWPSDKLSRKFAHLFSKTRYLYREKRAKNCDIGIYIGGSLFMEKRHWKKSVTDFQSMQQNKQHFFVMGANFGPYKETAFKQTYDQLFNKCTDVCFRDTFSKSQFPRSRNVRHGRDIVFELDTPNTYQTDNTIIISVIYPSIRPELTGYDQAYFDKLADLACKLIDAGYDVIWLACCSNEKDNTAIEEIISHTPRTYWDYMHTFTYNGNIQETLNLFEKTTAIIATRFHAMILAAVFRKPVFPIIYNNKITEVLYDHQFRGMNTRVSKIATYPTKNIVQAINSQKNMIHPNQPQENKQFKVLDEYLAATK